MDRKFSVGDKVTPINDERVPVESLGRVFEVEKVNPKNLRCKAVDGGRGINFPPELLLPATDENVAAGKGPGPMPEPFVHFTIGEVVTLANPWKDWGTETPLVVTGGRGDKINVTPLGGDRDRYLRIRPTGLVKRDMDWLAEALI